MSGRPRITVGINQLDYYVKTKTWDYRLTAYFSGEKEAPKIYRSPQTDPPPFDAAEYSQLLCGINFVAKPGEVSAILGPSGCGKTTLLNVIANRSTGRPTGCVTFNGVETTPQKLSGAVTMLPANDRLLPFLTVEETLMFTAFLKMPDSSHRDRKERVDQVVTELGLAHVRNTIIGGSWKKGLSSGEMRRCSIAQELISDPSVLIMDEPTSGLDAVLAFEVVYLLHKLAHEGKRTIILTLHQPRSSIYDRIDNLTLMAKGRVLYTGPRAEARNYFLKVVDHDINSAGNPADELIDIASDVPVKDTGDIGSKSTMRFAGNYQADLTIKCADAFEDSTRRQEVLSELQGLASNPGDVTEMRKKTRSFIIQWLLEIYAVTFRTFRNQWRNPLALGGSIFVQVFMGAFLGAIFYKLPYTYLPASKPMDISDPNSGAMQLLNSKPVQFIAYGIDGQGTNPFVDIIVDGIDGNGSDPFSALLDSGAVPRLANMMPCTHRRLGLNENPMYANTDFSEYNDLWGGSNQSTSAFVGGVWNVPHTVSNLMQTLQVADHVFYHVDWHDAWRFCRQMSAMNYMSCYFCPPDTSLVLEAASLCTGVPPPPTSPTLSCLPDKSYEDFPDPDDETTTTTTTTSTTTASTTSTDKTTPSTTRTDKTTASTTSTDKTTATTTSTDKTTPSTTKTEKTTATTTSTNKTTPSTTSTEKTTPSTTSTDKTTPSTTKTDKTTPSTTSTDKTTPSTTKTDKTTASTTSTDKTTQSTTKTDQTTASTTSTVKTSASASSEAKTEVTKSSPNESSDRRRLGLKDADWVGVADKSGTKKRKLQAAAIVSLKLSDLKDFLPPRLLKLQRTFTEYVDALKGCTHPVCHKLRDLMNSGTGSSAAALSDYGSVLGAVMNVAGALYFAVAAIGFACYDGLTSICQERAMLNREIANKTYHPSSYLIGKVVGDFLFQAIPGVLFVSVFYFLVDVEKGPHYSWYMYYMVVSIVNIWASYGFAYGVSAWSPSMEVAVIGAPLMMVIFLCCSGFFVRDAAIPSGISWLRYFSTYRWGFFALMLNQFPIDQHYWGLPNSFNLALAGITEHSFAKCVGAMALLGLIYRIMAYAGLRLSNKKAGIET